MRLLTVAGRMALAPTEFWQMTPKEFNAYLDGFVEREQEAHQNKMIQSYLTAYWNRVKKMPSLKEVLDEPKTKQEKTPEQMLETIKRLNEAFGGTVSQ